MWTAGMPFISTLAPYLPLPTHLSFGQYAAPWCLQKRKVFVLKLINFFLLLKTFKVKTWGKEFYMNQWNEAFNFTHAVPCHLRRASQSMTGEDNVSGLITEKLIIYI